MVTMILGVVGLGLLIIGKWDEPIPLNSWGAFGILVFAVGQKIMIICLTIGEPKSNQLLLSVIGGCLILACVTDLVLCQVYNFIWWIALAAGAILLWRSLYIPKMEAEAVLTALLLFLVLQFTVFCRTYGKADGYAFCTCAVTEAARGMKITGFLSHMLLAYALLFLVQAFRGNLNQQGNLKKPVPFLPYIAVTFWAMMVLCA